MKRIIISPAILERELVNFERELNAYSQFASQIDIDINIANDLFNGKITLGVKKVIELIKKTSLDLRFGIHLMVSNPLKEILPFLKAKVEDRCTFYLQQETKIGEILNYEHREKLNLAMSLNSNTSFQGIEFYKMFEEIQLMTVQTGFQGGKFLPEVLDRIEILKKLNYSGRVSIDGGVNLKTASIIRNFEVDRVSVGSYFSKSENLELDWQKLDLALNLGR